GPSDGDPPPPRPDLVRRLSAGLRLGRRPVAHRAERPPLADLRGPLGRPARSRGGPRRGPRRGPAQPRAAQGRRLAPRPGRPRARGRRRPDRHLAPRPDPRDRWLVSLRPVQPRGPRAPRPRRRLPRRRAGAEGAADPRDPAVIGP